MITVQTTDFSRAQNAQTAFQSNMFSTTKDFALLDDAGRIKVETAQLRHGGIRVSRIRSTGHRIELQEDSAVTVLLPTAGQLRVRVAAAEYRITPNSVCVFAPGARRTRAEPALQTRHFHAKALMLPQSTLHALVHQRRDSTKRWSSVTDGLPIPAKHPKAAQLHDLLQYISQHFDQDALPLSDRAAAAMATLIEEFLLDMIFDAEPALTEDSAPSAGWLRVRLAEEIMRARSDEPLSMASLAREVGVGLRSLQLAFMETRAMGPRDVLLRLRLERARERLLGAHPQDTVTSIALDCGFAHLGRFPAAYRIAFGELPTETLMRARRLGH